MKKTIHILYLLLTRGLATSILLLIFMLFGVFDPLLSWMSHRDLRQNAPAWASRVMQLELPADATVLDVRQVDYGGMQGDGSNEVLIALTPEQAEAFFAQVENNANWQLDTATCIPLGAETCTPPEPNCYTWMDEESSRWSSAEGSFCRSSGKLRLRVIWT